MLRKIHQELVLIRKELQAIRSSMELDVKAFDFSIHQEVEALKEQILK